MFNELIKRYKKKKLNRLYGKIIKYAYNHGETHVRMDSIKLHGHIVSKDNAKCMYDVYERMANNEKK